MSFDPQIVKNDFPILSRLVNGRPLVYLDSGATSQKPQSVIAKIMEYYQKHNANVHRGAHTLGDESTELYQKARTNIAQFIGAKSNKEVIFVRNCTEAINLVARTWGEQNITKGDVILLTQMEHHSNIVPWQMLASNKGAQVLFVKVLEDGTLDLKDYEQKLKMEPKLVGIVQVSNALGTINPVKEMARLAHKAGAVVVVDGAQSVPHMKIDVQELGCDFLAFSGHKMLAPMGAGVLWGRKEILETMSPFMGGGGMIAEVHESGFFVGELPDKFEAGTPNVEAAVGLLATVDYLEKLGMDKVREHDLEIVEYALGALSECSKVRILGIMDAKKRSGSVSFVYEGVHGHDVATILDSEGVAVRSGHHCTMPLHEALGVVASIRASFNVYTTKDDIDALIVALGKVKKVFGR
jgi:cysteine desulfurase / selenocysteine lyase